MSERYKGLYLSDMHLKLDAISESISSLVIASKTIVKPTILPSKQLPILNLFSINSAGLIQVEEWLQTEQNKKNLVF